LADADRYYEDRFEAIASRFDPRSTAILASNWHHVEYYLPEYAVLPFEVVSKWEMGEGSPTEDRGEVVANPAEMGLQLDGQGQAVIVVLDPELMAFSESPTSTSELPLRNGETLEYYVLTGNQAFHYGRRSFGVDYVLYGPAEQALGQYDPGDSPLFSAVFSSPRVTVYCVNTENDD
jgi:hypothetical protein